MDEIITETISLSGAAPAGSTMSNLSLPQMTNAGGGHEAASSQPSPGQQQQQQLKKLYFKPSSTEVLHSAILLKARNPNNNNNSANNAAAPSSTSAVSPMPALNAAWKPGENASSKVLYPKLASVSNLLSISSSYNTNNSNNNAAITITNPSADSFSSQSSGNQGGVAAVAMNAGGSNFYADELDSPLKIKENILASIRNLKPVLAGFDPLRSSTSDDEDSHLDTLERKKIVYAKEPAESRKMVVGEPACDMGDCSTSEIVILGSTVGSGSSSTALPAVQSSNSASAALQIKQPPRQTYLRTSSTNYSSSTRINSLTVTTTPVIVRSTANLAQIQLKRLCSKRGKEEALSNSSSSDEEDQQKRTSPSSQKLQQLILNTPGAQPTASPLKLAFNKSNTNLLTVNMLSQPQITPVVSSTAASSGANVAASSASSTSCSSLASSIAVATNNSTSSNVTESVSSFSAAESENVTSPSSSSSSSSPSFSSSSASSSPYLKSQKSSIDQDYDSKYTNSFSAASPTSICSSSATNDGTIDLQDDNSSTASGPIYVRQPGFEHHAHEIVAAQSSSSSNSATKIRNFSNLNLNERIPAAERITRVKKSDSTNALLANKPTSVVTKAKKKLCMMTSDAANESPSTMLALNSGNLIPDRHNVHLKPLSNKAKREGIPMRLRALPPSFWQQPNQPNPLPGTMYLPPLFKSDLEQIDACPDAGLEGVSRDVKISPANTDLLFKLFENVERDKKLQYQLHMQQKNKLRPSKPGMPKALLKGEDPCIADAEGLFPLLTLDTRNETVQYLAFKTSGAGTSDLTSNGLSSSSPMISSTSGNSLLASTATTAPASTLPLLQYEQNYSQALSEVVAAL